MMKWPDSGLVGLALNGALAFWLLHFLLEARSARKRSQEVLAQSESFRALFANAHTGVALLDARGHIISGNFALQHLLGYHEHELRAMTLTQLLHPTDVLRHRTQFDALREARHGGYQIEQSYLTIDGRSLRGRLAVFVVESARGRSARPFAIAVIEDLTRYRQAEAELSATRAVVHDLYEVLADEHLYLTEKMRALLVIGCRRFHTPTGVLGRVCGNRFEVVQTISPDERVRRGQVYEIVSAREADRNVARGQIQGPPRSSPAEYSTDWRDYPFFGVTGIETYLGAPIFVAGEMYGTLNFASAEPRAAPFDAEDTDLVRLMARWLGGEIERRQARAELEAKQQELLEANALLEVLAATDGLTGLKNRRAFEERLDMEFKRSLRYGTPLSLLLLDVDMFKQFNDTFGHPVGDEVLKTVARALQGTVRAIDCAARFGGEEFVILLPDTDEEGVLSLAERVRATIETAPWKERAITASLGAATKTGEMSEPTDLVSAADAALYHSKLCGRNRAAHARDIHPALATTV
jgi:diguanylate cyclase (GGDEF)-like protein/PAS domain S-box-containing protein